MDVCVFGGAGQVGASVAAGVVTAGLARHVVLVDRDRDVLAVQEMDLSLLAATVPGCRVRCGSPADAAGADVVVFTASVRHRDGVARADFLAENRRILQSLLDVLAPSWDGILIVVTNPVDALGTIADRALGPGSTVVGYNTNDSLRLRAGIAGELRCHPSEVGAWAIGEHGPAMVPLFDRVTRQDAAVVLSPAQRRRAHRYAVDWYERWQAHGTGRTSAWATGGGVVRLLAALTAPEESLTTASVPLRGQYGIDDVCLGVPVLAGRNCARIVEWTLSDADRSALTATARELDGCAPRRTRRSDGP